MVAQLAPLQSEAKSGVGNLPGVRNGKRLPGRH